MLTVAELISFVQKHVVDGNAVVQLEYHNRETGDIDSLPAATVAVCEETGLFTISDYTGPLRDDVNERIAAADFAEEDEYIDGPDLFDIINELTSSSPNCNEAKAKSKPSKRLGY